MLLADSLKPGILLRILHRTLILAPSLAACQNEQSSNVEAYQKAVVQFKEINLALPKLESTKIVYKVTEGASDSQDYDETAMIRVEFPGLTKVGFDKLKSLFPFQPDKRFIPTLKYTLTDFLPPMAEALDGHEFHEQQQVENKGTVNEKTSQVLGNCWGTAYELVRGGSREFTVFYATPKIIDDVLSASHYSQPVAEASGREIRDLRTPANVLPGDILLIYGPEVIRTTPEGELTQTTLKKAGAVLEHGALYVGDDLYFEKPSSESSGPYRIVTARRIENKYNGSLYKTLSEGVNLYKYVWRRFSRTDLPHPSQLLSNSPRWRNVSVPVKFHVDTESGRAKLAPEAFTKGHFQKFLAP